MSGSIVPFDPYHRTMSQLAGGVSAERSRVLLVADEPTTRDPVRQVLLQHGFQLFDAGNGGEAIKRTREMLPDLVLADAALPDSDGFELIGQLRDCSTVPIILLTMDDDGERIRALGLGADDCVSMPFNSELLTARIKALLRRCSWEGCIHSNIIAV